MAKRAENERLSFFPVPIFLLYPLLSSPDPPYAESLFISSFSLLFNQIT